MPDEETSRSQPKTLTSASSRILLVRLPDGKITLRANCGVAQLIALLRRARRQLGNILKGIKTPFSDSSNPRASGVLQKEEVLDTSITVSKDQIRTFDQ